MDHDQFGIDVSKIANHSECVNQWLKAAGDVEKQSMKMLAEYRFNALLIIRATVGNKIPLTMDLNI